MHRLLNALETESIQQRIEMYELLKDQGLDVENELLLAREQLFNKRMESLDLEYQAERKNADDKLFVDRKYRIARQNLEREFTINFSKELNKRLDDAKKTQDKINDLPDSKPASGNSSGSQKAQLNLGETSTDPSPFKLEFSGFKFRTEDEREQKKQEQAAEEQRRKLLSRRLNPKAFLKVQREDQERARERARREASRDGSLLNPEDVFGKTSPGKALDTAAQLKAADPSAVLKEGQSKMSPKVEAPTSVVNNTTNTVTVNVESSKTRTVKDPEEAVREVRKAITDNQYYDPNAGVR